MIKSANNIPVDKLLGLNNNSNELVYKIPPYQREYSWKKEQWENLFDDILDNEQGYFLGSIICIDQNIQLDVIDGQQRLTTVSILLNAILNIINIKINNETISLNNKKYRKPYDNLEDKIYIEEDEKSRLVLSIQNNNNDDYEYILFINNFLANKEKPAHFGKRRISKAFEYFKYRLLEVDEEGNLLFSIEDIFTFYKKVISSLVVKIEVNDIASAFTLFESINNRGVPLTPIDLIKNSIIGQMEYQGYNANSINNDWQTIVNNIEAYDAQVRFMRHYYNAFHNNPKIKLQSYSKATKSNIIHIFSEHIKKDVNFIFYDLIKKSNIYTIFVNPQNIKDIEFLPYKEKLTDLTRLKVAPAYSLLLYIFDKGINEDTIKILDFIENWFLRRHLTDFPGTSKLDQIFLDLINILDNTDENSYEKIKEFLTNEKRYKSDAEFKQFLKNSDLYIVNPNATRCLLTKLESSKRTKENKVNFWEETHKNKLIWSIEHILPQNPSITSDWNNIVSKEQKDKYLHRLGNLTLTCYNSSLSNKSFKEKVFIKDNMGNDIGLKSNNIYINSTLKDIDIFNIDIIERRSDFLIEELFRII